MLRPSFVPPPPIRGTGGQPVIDIIVVSGELAQAHHPDWTTVLGFGRNWSANGESATGEYVAYAVRFPAAPENVRSLVSTQTGLPR